MHETCQKNRKAPTVQMLSFKQIKDQFKLDQKIVLKKSKRYEEYLKKIVQDKDQN